MEAMIEPRRVTFAPDAVMALTELIGIMTDQLMEGNMLKRWDAERVVDLQLRLNDAEDGSEIEIGIDDVALLLDGMAFTEVMSVEFPFFDMVQWTSDFLTEELRRHWTEDEWRSFASR